MLKLIHLVMLNYSIEKVLISVLQKNRLLKEIQNRIRLKLTRMKYQMSKLKNRSWIRMMIT